MTAANVFDIGENDHPGGSITRPSVLYTVSEPGVGTPSDHRGNWHSAAFTWDGEVLILGWEPGGGAAPIHNGNVVPVRGRHVLTSGNYQADTSLTDFTDPANPFTLAFSKPGAACRHSSEERGRRTGTTGRATSRASRRAQRLPLPGAEAQAPVVAA